MENERVDARVIQILRWSLIVQIVFLLLSSFSPRIPLLRGNFGFNTSDYLIFVSAVVLGFVLLLISRKENESRITKTTFLILLYSITLITIFARHIFALSLRRYMPDTAPALLRWDAMFFLIIPLVFIAWQYSLRQVIIYSLIVLLADFIPTLFDPTRGVIMLARHLPSEFQFSTNLDDPRMNLLFLLADFMGSFARSLILVIVGWIENSLVTLQREQHAQLADANKKLRNFALTSEKLAQTQERNRLARELHDTLAHTLSGTSLQLEGIKSLFERDPLQAKTLLAQTMQNTKTGLAETRRALIDLRSSELEAFGLTQAIQNLATSAAERGGFSVECHLDKNLDVQPEEVGHTLYRTAQEALENILRHANAGRVSVNLLREESVICLTVRDDGRGFDPAQIKNEQLGIRGMRERVEMLGGRFEIESQPGKGSEIRVSIEAAHD